MFGTAGAIQQSNGSTPLLRGSGDFVLSALILAIVALMILPLPLFMLDFLLAINIALGVVLVLMSVYVSSPVQFSVFPSVLLISTLFRLALSVATTRMILLHADAGSIIDTFGNLVAGGNIVVGMVVFSIITIVQFLVIAKGAERVAEVGARFSLDAMPGKQMSIDSDLRSGLIDKQEAKRKRAELELESQLHGSMDGAMKFVKGDAIAGIVIIFVNLLGGLTIGITQMGLGVGDAVSIYSILTIGDGMVAQIPALFAAMSAGLIVSRVAKEGSTENLGTSIQKQLTAIPKVLLIAGVASFCFALVPGFPTGTFMLLGLILMFCGAMLIPNWRMQIENTTRPAFGKLLQAKQSGSSVSIVATAYDEPPGVSHTTALKLEFPAAWQSDNHSLVIQEHIETSLLKYQNRIGLDLPQPTYEWNPETSDIWRLFIYEVPVASGPISHDAEGMEKLSTAISQALTQHGHLFVGVQEVSALISKTSADYPDIVKETLRVLQLANLTVILRKLVEEDQSIRNMRTILEALMSVAEHEKDCSNLVEIVRIALAREISYRYAPDGSIAVLTLAPGLEETCASALRSTNAGQQMALAPEISKLFRANVVSAVKTADTKVLLVPVVLRRHCRKLLSDLSVELIVLSFEELSSSVQLQVKQTIDINLSSASVSPAGESMQEPNRNVI